MLQRALIVTSLVLVLAVFTVPSVHAGPPPGTQCSNVCGPGVSCLTNCWARGPLDGKWYWITCTAYDSLFGGGGSCAISTTTGDREVDRFLRSLESMAEPGSTIPGV